MARKSLIARQKKREKLVLKYAEKRKKLKAEGNYVALEKLPRDSSPTRLKSRCAVTGRSRGYIRKFGISRIVFRQMATEGLIPGVKKGR